MALIDRVDPIVARTHLEVSGRVTLSADDEELEELKAARFMGANHEKLLELFGGNRLPQLLRLEAQKAAAQAKVVGGEVIEAEPVEVELAAPASTEDDF